MAFTLRRLKPQQVFRTLALLPSSRLSSSVVLLPRPNGGGLSCFSSLVSNDKGGGAQSRKPRHLRKEKKESTLEKATVNIWFYSMLFAIGASAVAFVWTMFSPSGPHHIASETFAIVEQSQEVQQRLGTPLVQPGGGRAHRSSGVQLSDWVGDDKYQFAEAQYMIQGPKGHALVFVQLSRQGGASAKHEVTSLTVRANKSRHVIRLI
eukprot:g44407.t1